MSFPELDTSLFLFINKNLQNSFFDVIMPVITSNLKFVFLPFILWALIKDRKKLVLPLALSFVSLALADGSGHVLKDMITRTRPCNALENVNLLVGCSKSFSMPSNHASNAFGFALVFLFFRRDVIRYILVFIAAAAGFSRVYVGVHYPFDAAAGALLGAVSAYFTVLLYKWAVRIYEKRSYEQAMYFVVLLVGLFRIYYILTSPFDLGPDEAHYWEWSRHPDLSYYSKGPAIAYIIYIGTAIFGSNVFGVRIFAVVFSALSSIVLFRTAKELYDEKTGFASALLVQIVPLFSVFGVLMTIDSPFIFFWILSLYLFHRVVKHETDSVERKIIGITDSVIPACRESFPKKDARQAGMTDKQKESHYSCRLLGEWLLLGVAIGLGLLTKYTMSFFILSGFLFMVFYKDARRLLAGIGPYASLITSMIVFSPVIIWNYMNGWVTFKHTAGQANISGGFSLSFNNFLEFAGSQIGVVTPILFVMIFIALWKLRKDREGSFLFWFAIPVIVFFALKSLQGKVQANWAMTGYATGLIAFSAYYIRNIGLSKKIVGIFAYSAVLLSLTVVVLTYSLPALDLPQKKDPSMRFFGWKELGQEADRIYDEMLTEGPLFIFSDKYQISGELAFYMKGHPATYCVNLGRRMNQYDLWPGFENLIGHNAVFVRDKTRIKEDVEKAFEKCLPVPVGIRMKNNKVVKFTIFKCYDFRGIKMKPAESF
jgi:membrane-associated phospholipid phosphatase